MLGADAFVNLFLVVLLVAGVLILVNGMIDIGFGAIRNRFESFMQRIGRPSIRRKPGAAILPPRQS